MREYAILGCAIGLAACGGSKAGGRTDSLPHDSTTMAAPPAVTPTLPADSLASRSRNGATTSVKTDARTSPGAKGVSGTVARSDVRQVSPAPAGDTVRGIVSVVGTSRDQHGMIAPAGGGRRVELTGRSAALIGHPAGAAVMVAGPRSGTSIEPPRFIVRTVDGAPAIDGTLNREGSALFIVTSDGTRTRTAVPPPALDGHEGARVWITGDPSKAVSSFGFIDPPR